DMIDWEKSRVWGEGGYYCRIFFNVKGREPQGVIPPQEYDSFRQEIKAKLEALEDEEGKCINTRVFLPEETYRECKNIPPDLVVYLGNLDWRSAGSVGIGSVYLYENDTGPDDANHAQDGILIWYIPGKQIKSKEEVYSIYDIAPSILRYFEIEIPPEMIGNSII
ncbi:MAG: alkaline phosphatase family protein, partial [Candidatus Aminicenantes bacterium]|nr:alkaline phosphatase family protein [Candidatus Aminicenantes bacterium]